MSICSYVIIGQRFVDTPGNPLCVTKDCEVSEERRTTGKNVDDNGKGRDRNEQKVWSTHRSLEQVIG